MSTEHIFVKIMQARTGTAHELITVGTGSQILFNGSRLTIRTTEEDITRDLKGPVYVMNNQGVTVNQYTPE